MSHARLSFEPRDVWLGVYWTWRNNGGGEGRRRRDIDDPRYGTSLVVDVCLVPCFPVRFELLTRHLDRYYPPL